MIIIAPDERDAGGLGLGGGGGGGGGGTERGLAKEWAAAEVRCRRAVEAVLLTMQVMISKL